MINIDFLTLKAFFIENIDFLIGARLQKIQQPARRDLVLSLRNNSESRKLYINIDPKIYHISFMSEENEKKRNLVIPKKPPMFCMLLRKYLEGCKISDALVIENERIIEFHFETMDEYTQKRSLALCVELMGKHSNIILYDRENSVITGCAHNVGEEKSRYRELRGGLKYIRPPKNQSGTVLSNELKLQFNSLSQAEIEKYLTSETFRPAVKDDKYTLFQELMPDSIPQQSVNRMLDNYYADFQEKFILNSDKNKLNSEVNSRLKKVNSSIDKIENLLKKRDNSEKYKKYGELLTANIYQKKDYQNQIDVMDYSLNENITIPLDNAKTISENAQRYFKLYTKSKMTKEKSTQILENLYIQKENLESILYSIKIAKTIKDLSDIKSETGFISEHKDKKEIMSSVTKIMVNNFTVYIGKNNKQNDFIVSKLAKDEDYWFHTRLCAGSHVLLKVEAEEPDEKTIYEYCKLAREYSSATQPSKVGVIYTRGKYIKKPPSAPLGYVTYKNEKEILV